MLEVLKFLVGVTRSLFRSRAACEAEVLFLRQQLIVLQRSSTKRVRVRPIDKLIFLLLYRFFPSLRSSAIIFRPETLIRWHRAGFRAFWRWKSRRRLGRPPIQPDIRALVRRIAHENPLWGAPRIHGELLKLGINVAQSTVAKYMGRRTGPPSQGWRTFLRHHAPHIAAIDLFVVPTVSFKLLYAPIIVQLERRVQVLVNATANPTARWVSQQITEAFPWDEAPGYLIRDRDGIYGLVFRRRLGAMGIRDRPVAFRCPWQNGYAERLIGSIRRECLDHVVVFGEQHLRQTVSDYARYYNTARTHLALNKDAPISRKTTAAGAIQACPILGGLHHLYSRAT